MYLIAQRVQGWKLSLCIASNVCFDTILDWLDDCDSLLYKEARFYEKSAVKLPLDIISRLLKQSSSSNVGLEAPNASI